MGVRILIDGDACPVKDEIYKVAWRYGIPATLVSNAHIRIPDHPLIDRVIVSDGFDAADDWIAERANTITVVVTADILLAERCLKAGASVVAPNGKPFDERSIGAAVATRALMDHLRVGGDIIGGPPPFRKEDRSRFLSTLDSILVRLMRSGH